MNLLLILLDRPPRNKDILHLPLVPAAFVRIFKGALAKMAGKGIIPIEYVNSRFWTALPLKFNCKKSSVEKSKQSSSKAASTPSSSLTSSSSSSSSSSTAHSSSSFKQPTSSHQTSPKRKVKINKKSFVSSKNMLSSNTSSFIISNLSYITFQKARSNDDGDDFENNNVLPNYSDKNMTYFLDALKKYKVTVAMRRMKG